MYKNFEESEHSKIFDNKDFGYWKVSVQRPLRKKAVVTEETVRTINQKIGEVLALEKINKNSLEELELKGTKGAIDSFKKEDIISIVRVLKDFIREEPYMNLSAFEKEFNKKAKTLGLGNNAIKIFEKTGLDELFIETDENAEIIKDSKGNAKVDTSLSYTENIPLNCEGGIDAYIEKEVLPFVPDAFVDYDATKIGYEISFTKYFYKPK